MNHNLIRNSDAWLSLKPLLENKITKAQGLLEDNLEIDKTNLLRGEIQAYRSLIREIEQDLTNHPGQPVPYGQEG